MKPDDYLLMAFLGLLLVCGVAVFFLLLMLLGEWRDYYRAGAVGRRNNRAARRCTKRRRQVGKRGSRR
jgi:hypothetical protein